jgi:hypothetical protein
MHKVLVDEPERKTPLERHKDRQRVILKWFIDK